MTKLCRPTAVCGVFFCMLVLAATSGAQTRPPIAEQIAKANGLDSFGQIEAIRYTFHASFPGVNISRSWVWEPKTNQVSYEAKDKDGKTVKVTYLRSEIGHEPPDVRDKIDPAFLNDQYNLLFPLHVYWDASADVQDTGMHKLPLGQGSAKRVVVKYPSQGGYAPGDTWELYVSPTDRVEEFVYHRGGSSPPKLVIARWTGYEKAGPLVISTDRRGTADGKPLRIFFTDVAVKLAGSNTWMKAR
jgi:hypothetical protein